MSSVTNLRDQCNEIGTVSISNPFLTLQRKRARVAGGLQVSVPAPRFEPRIETSPAAATQGKVEAINGLRAIAVLAVIFHHVVATNIFHWGFSAVKVGPLTLFPGSFISNGWVGVKLFFILSGIVLFLPYAQGKRSFDSKGDIWEFYKRRSGRLMPLFALSVLVMVAFSPWATDGKSVLVWLAVMGSLLFGLHPQTFTPKPNWVLWSLATEIYFSVIFPFLVRLVNRFGIGWVLAGSVLVSTATRFAAVVTGHAAVASPYHDFFSTSILGCLEDFVIGMLICHLMVKGTKARWSVPPAVVTAAALVGLWLSLMLCDAWATGLLSLWAKPFISTCINVSLFALVGSLVLKPEQTAAKPLGLWPMQLVGMMCYSLYVWHGIVMNHMMPSEKYYTWSNIAAYGLVLAGLSWCTYRYVEFSQTRDWKDLLPARRVKLKKRVFVA